MAVHSDGQYHGVLVMKKLTTGKWKNPLFKETITVSELRGTRGNEILSGVTGETVVRVLHRDKAIKVVITEDFFLTLLNIYESDKVGEITNTPVEELMRRGLDELKTMMTKLDSEGRARSTDHDKASGND